MTPATSTARIEALFDALPFIQEHRGKTFVVKYGGSAMEDDQLVERTLRDVVFLEAVGVRPVLVHGGGKLITDRMRTAGMKAQFVNGLRVTDAASISLVEEALDGSTNPMIVGKLREFGGRAEGLRGISVVLARSLGPQTEGKGKTVRNVDIGYVGEVAGINAETVRRLVDEGTIPVISPLGRDETTGETLNVNADLVAAALAAELRAAKLIFLSDVPGLMRDPAERDSLIPSVTSAQITKLLADGIITGGMIPKVSSAVDALGRGVGRVHFTDGRLAHALLREVFSNRGVGTEIVP